MPECLNTLNILGRKFQGFSKSKSRLCIYTGDFILCMLSGVPAWPLFQNRATGIFTCFPFRYKNAYSGLLTALVLLYHMILVLTSQD